MKERKSAVPEASGSTAGGTKGGQLIVKLPYLHEHPKSGVLYYRRVIPGPLRPFITTGSGKPLTEIKVSLRCRAITDSGGHDRYNAAHKNAEARLTLAQKRVAKQYDRLDAPLIQYLADTFLQRHLEIDEASRWRLAPEAFPFETRQDREGDYEASRELLEEYDLPGLVEHWRDYALSYSAALGYTLDSTTEAFALLCRALGEAACNLWLTVDRRNDGAELALTSNPAASNLPLPSAGRTPVPSDGGRTFEDIALSVLDTPRLKLSETVREKVRGGLRFLRETTGLLTPAELTREKVSGFLNMLAQRPARLPKQEREMPLPELVALYEGRQDVPRLTDRSQEAYIMALNARWVDAQSEGYISKALASPFGERKFNRAGQGPKKAVGFSDEELRAYFSLPPFTEGYRPIRGRGDAIYWMPLIALFTGARPEEVAQLLVTDLFQRERDGRWLIRFTDEGVHPVKGQQSLKTAGKDTGRRAFPIPQPLVELGLLAYRQHLVDAGHTALFPLLRVKGKRGHIFPYFGEWWSSYVYENGVLKAGTGRQPFRELRHTWSTAARSSRIYREAMEYIQGHKAPGGGSSNAEYGETDGLGDQIDDLRFRVDILKLVKPWQPPE